MGEKVEPLSIGEQIKVLLGLEEFKYVYIQEVKYTPQRVYLVSFDSQRSKMPISPQRLKHSPSTVVKKVKSVSPKTIRPGFRSLKGAAIRFLLGKPLVAAIVQPTLYFEETTLGIPRRVEEFTKRLPTNSVVVRRDISSDFFGSRKVNTQALSLKSVLDDGSEDLVSAIRGLFQ